MKYYTNTDNTQVYAEPADRMIEELGLVEYTNPVWQGKHLPQHKNLSQLQTKEDGTFYEFYNADGTADTTSITEKEQSEFRAKRDRLLADTDPLVLRHNREVTLNVTTTLTETQFVELEQYRQDLADATIDWVMPVKPTWME